MGENERGAFMKQCNFIFTFIIAISLIVSGCASTTQLIKSSINGDYLDVKKLIDSGANINEPDSNGVTPLMHAICYRKPDVAKYLIESGADIKVKDKQGYDALLYAVSYATEDGRLEIVKILIDKGAYLESKDLLGLTPLALASYYPSYPYSAKVIKLLIKSGANINATVPEGETVLDLALSSAQGDVVDDLIKSGNINLLVPEAGKARLFFVCSDLYDYVNVTVGKQSKRLNQHMSSGTRAGVAFIDVDPGKHTADANMGRTVSGNLTSIDVISGQTYYYRVTQNMGTRITGYVLLMPSSLLDKATGNNPFTITPLNESEAKQQIKEILKSKELK